jgi:5-methylcytosine-specific restriction enzyme subunit McrC
LTTPRIVNVVEREDASIPISELWDNGKLEILPEVLNRGFFQIRLSNDQLTLSAGRYIGLIPLNQRVAINVQPKTPISNLLRLLGRSGARVKSLEFFPVGYPAAASRPLAMLEPIASALAAQLRKLRSQGFHKEYTLRDSDDPPLRGRPLFRRSLDRYWSRGSQHRAAVSFHDLTANLPPNRVIKSGVDHLLRQFRYLQDKPTVLLRELAEHQDLFMKMQIEDIDPLRLEAARAFPLTGAYQEAFNLAALVVQGRGIDLPAGGELRLPSFILDMADVFESYVRNTLATRLAPAFAILDGNQEGARPLYDETPSPPATPDIVVNAHGRTRLIADAKYKDGPSREDLNQVLTYAIRYGVKKTLLACLPAAGNAQLQRLGSIAGIEIYVYRFPLGGDLDSEELNFANTVRELLLVP